SSSWRSWWQIGPGPVALGLPIPTRASRRLGAFGGAQAARGLPRWLGWLRSRLLLSRRVAHNRTDRPGEGLEVAIHRVVIGGMAALALAPVEVVAIAVHAVDELTQHTGVHPPLGLSPQQEPRLQLVQHAIGFIDLGHHHRHNLAPFGTEARCFRLLATAHA